MNNSSDSKQHFFCRALQGESSYNICINADMTVSCNCQDYDGSGHIGDLSTESFEQIFHGKTAQLFREQLFAGNLPISTCQYCNERFPAEEHLADLYLHNYHLPHRGIMVENTSACNLDCIACRRKELIKIRKRLSMSLEDMRKVSLTVRDLGIRRVCFYNLGEPFLSPNVLQELLILREYNPKLYIVCSTNGALLEGDDKQKAGLLMDWVIFSIDGTSQDALSKYQLRGNFESSYHNMRELVVRRDLAGQTAPLIEWKYVVFAFNDSEDQIIKAIDMAKAAKVDAISFFQGGGPAQIKSKRFFTDPFLKTIGVPVNKRARRLVLTPNGEKIGKRIA